jgi:hypothetical protein
MFDRLLGFITDDWESIPQNYKYVIIAGGLLVANAWLLDHWGTKRVWEIGTIDIAWYSYFLGLFLIILALFILIISQVIFLKTIVQLRWRYRLSLLFDKIYIYTFKGGWYLFDTRNQKYFHIRPWKTVEDLQWEGRATYLNFKFDTKKLKKLPIENTSKTIDLSGYKYSGKITTRED